MFLKCSIKWFTFQSIIKKCRSYSKLWDFLWHPSYLVCQIRVLVTAFLWVEKHETLMYSKAIVIKVYLWHLVGQTRRNSFFSCYRSMHKKSLQKNNGMWHIPLHSLVISTKIKIIHVVFCVREVLGYLLR